MIIDGPTAALLARESELPELALLLDDDRRADLLGAPLRIERLRWKPGTSIVLAVVSEHGARHAIYSHISPRKVAAQVARAAEHHTQARRVADRVALVPMMADRAFADALGAVLGHGEDALAQTRVLRYNPQRRLVIARGEEVLRFAEHLSPGDDVARALAAQGHPVQAPTTVAPGATSTPWWGTGDLSEGATPEDHHRVGEILAAVHASAVDAEAGPDAVEVARAAAAGVTAVRPDRADAVERVARRAAEAAGDDSPVIGHGDFSPDQVLVQGNERRMIDFDRAGRAPRERDLGSYLATGGTMDVVHGYRAAGGRVGERELVGWRALAHLQRAVEGFRRAESDWAHTLDLRVAMAEEVLG